MRGRAASAAQENFVALSARREWLQKRARYMRAHPTDAERKLWYLLRDRRLSELKWRRQHIIDDRYIVDFISFECRLIVEADGSQHADNRNDIERDAYLTSQDFRVLRFWNSEVLSNIDGVAVAILSAIESFCRADARRPLTLPSPARGEGLVRSPSSDA